MTGLLIPRNSGKGLMNLSRAFSSNVQRYKYTGPITHTVKLMSSDEIKRELEETIQNLRLEIDKKYLSPPP